MARKDDQSGVATFAIPRGTITAVPNTGSLAISIKTPAGADPSPTDPLFAAFASSGASSGTAEGGFIAAALSLTIPSGATLGATSGVPFRLWLLLITDPTSGLRRLGIVNCWGGLLPSIFTIGEGVLAEPFIIDSGADNSHRIYSSSDATGYYLILGYLEWSAGLFAAGTWTAPSSIVLYRRGTPLPGQVVQEVVKALNTVVTGTTLFLYDDSVPLYSAGNPIGSNSLYPFSQANLVDTDLLLQVAYSAVSPIVAMVWGSLTSGMTLGAICVQNTVVDVPIEIALKTRTLIGLIPPDAPSPLSFGFSVGGTNAGTLTVNGVSGARKLGGAMRTFFRVTEIMG